LDERSRAKQGGFRVLTASGVQSETELLGVELDRKLAALLFHLGVTVPDALLTT